MENTSSPMQNRYSGHCWRCAADIAVNAGHAIRQVSNWVVECADLVDCHTRPRTEAAIEADGRAVTAALREAAAAPGADKAELKTQMYAWLKNLEDRRVGAQWNRPQPAAVLPPYAANVELS